MARIDHQVLTLSYDDQGYVEEAMKQIESGKMTTFTIRVEGYDITVCHSMKDTMTAWVTKNEWRSD